MIAAQKQQLPTLIFDELMLALAEAQLRLLANCLNNLLHMRKLSV
jgi:hypothetical protein